MEELKEKYLKWKKCMESKGLKVNAGKTKVMKSAENSGEKEKIGKYPCAVCGKNVGVNSILCTYCHGWVHKRCSGVKGSLSRERF